MTPVTKLLASWTILSMSARSSGASVRVILTLRLTRVMTSAYWQELPSFPPLYIAGSWAQARKDQMKHKGRDLEQESMTGSFLEEWVRTLDGQRAFSAWVDTLPGKTFTRKQFEKWVNRCPEFQAYVDQRVFGILADMKRSGQIYEKGGRVYLAR